MPRPQGRGDSLLQNMSTARVPTLPGAAHPQRAQDHTSAQRLPGTQGEDPPLQPQHQLTLTPHAPSPDAGICKAKHDPHCFLPPQDKLTKSLTYILGNQDMVQTQICELEETVRHTEVREGREVGPGPCLGWGQERTSPCCALRRKPMRSTHIWRWELLVGRSTSAWVCM